MQYIINKKMLSIPPYISTSWESVSSLHIETENNLQLLVVTLKGGTTVKIPALQGDILTKIFQTHTQFLEDGTTREPSSQNPGFPFNMENVVSLGLPMKLGTNIEGLGAAMQHNPEQANAPDLPKEVLEKIAAVSKIMGTGDPSLTMGIKAEPHCNCMHCQIARALHGEEQRDVPEREEEDIVTEDDLRFKTWDIQQSGDKLYTVTNPLDDKEQYSVFLGEPLGCTCGQKHCEHIKAVLNT